MVIDVTNRNMSIDEFFHQVDLDIQEAIHEMDMNLMLDKYNYLQENGVVMEAEQEKQGLIQKIKSIIGMLVEKVKNIWNTIKTKFREIKAKLTGDKKKKVEQAEAETDKEAKETIDQLNAEAKNPTEESGKKAHGIFSIFKKKQEKKVKEFNFNEEAYSDTMQGSDIKIWLDQYLKKDSSLRGLIVYPKSVPDNDEKANALLNRMNVSKDSNSVIGAVYKDSDSDKDFKVIKIRRWQYGNIAERLQQQLADANGVLVVEA